MQLHHHFQLTPWQLTSCQLGWIGVHRAAWECVFVGICICVGVCVYVCASSWSYNTQLLMQTQYA